MRIQKDRANDPRVLPRCQGAQLHSRLAVELKLTTLILSADPWLTLVDHISKAIFREARAVRKASPAWRAEDHRDRPDMLPLLSKTMMMWFVLKASSDKHPNRRSDSKTFQCPRVEVQELLAHLLNGLFTGDQWSSALP